LDRQDRETDWTVSPAEAGTRLDRFLAAPARLASRSKALAALERGKIFLNGEATTPMDAGRRLAPGDAIRVWMDRPGSAKPAPRPFREGRLEVLYEDASIIVVNKPAGVLAVPLREKGNEPSVLDDLDAHLQTRGRSRALVVHRIDRDTSGLVVFAKTAAAQARLRGQFRRREPERIYWALVYGHPDPSSGTWRDHVVWDRKALIQKQTHPRDPHGKKAIAEYRVLEDFADASLIEVRLRTGKRNQIRLQARLRGHTLVGERRYVFGPDALRAIAFSRQALHAARLAFVHPESGQPLRFEAPLPADLRALLARLRRGRREPRRPHGRSTTPTGS
jgi:23S rRNA pseudouridine1911/1915/1917 synthase